MQLAGHGGGDRLVVELADDRARDLAQDRQLGDAQRLLDALTLRRFFQLARLGAEPAHLLDQPRDLPARAQLGLAAQQRAPHDVFQVLARERLDEVLERSVGEGELHRLQRGVGGDHHDLDRGVDALDAAQDLQPVDLRHLDVEDDDVGPVGRDLLQRDPATVGGLDLVGRLEQHAERLARSQLVVHDQDAGSVERRRRGGHDRAGRVTRNASS